VNHPVTKILSAAPSAALGGGFLVRGMLSERPPIIIVDQLEFLAPLWAVVLELLCLGAIVFAFIPDRAWVIRARALIKFWLFGWAFAIMLAILFRSPSPGTIRPGEPDSWVYTRDWSAVGTALTVSTFYLADWWNEIHFRLGEWHSLQRLRTRAERLEIPLGE
jgi:hypothetical protein